MVVAPTAIKVASATEDGAICQVEPQVLSHVTLGALPATSPGRRKLAEFWVGGLWGGSEKGLCRPQPVQETILLFWLYPALFAFPHFSFLVLLPTLSLTSSSTRVAGLFTLHLGIVPRDGRRQASPGRDPSRVVQLLEIEGMLRHLTDFPIPSLYLLLPGGGIS